MRSSTRRVLLSVSVLALVAAVTACGSTSSKTSASATTAAGSATTAPGSATTAAEAQTTAPDDTKPKKVKATGGGSFCKKLADAVNKENAQSSQDLTPVGMKATFTNGLKLVDDAVSSAPSSIKPDLKVLQAALQAEDDALAKVNFDATKLSETELNSFATPAVSAASDKIDAYVKNTCGIDIGDDSSTSTP